MTASAPLASRLLDHFYTASFLVSVYFGTRAFSDCYGIALALENQWDETLRQYGESAITLKDGSALFWRDTNQWPWLPFKEFLAAIATPHIANLMIAEDCSLSYASAHRVRISSKDYGYLQFPIEDDTSDAIRNLLLSSACIASVKEFVKNFKVSSHLLFCVIILRS